MSEKYEKPSENKDFVPNTLGNLLKPLFLKPDLVDLSISSLKFIKKKNYAKSNEIIQECNLTKSQWYDTILPVLKKEGFIKKRGVFYELDSNYSLTNLKDAKAWIEFADIKRSQPEKLKEILVELMM